MFYTYHDYELSICISLQKLFKQFQGNASELGVFQEESFNEIASVCRQFSRLVYYSMSKETGHETPLLEALQQAQKPLQTIPLQYMVFSMPFVFSCSFQYLFYS
jgi:hypothetical protein